MPWSSTVHPTSANSARRRPVEALGAYHVLPVRQRILLIDDVITTGATMSAAASALKAAGASHVDGLAFARVLG
ncbi:MAG: phosphoribosyltransferase family protein [Collinsella intestinalis]